ncbi:MAG: hypothetical protein AAB578_02490, partial [Elusimicrobiota bacterium]
MTEKTLRNWAKRLAREAKGERLRGQGRPRTPRSELRGKIEKLREEWEKMTKDMTNLSKGPGARTLAEEAKVSRYLAEKFVANRKEKDRRKRNRTAKARRNGLRVIEGGVVTTMDGKHIGRQEEKRIEMQALRDRCDLFYEVAVVGIRMDAETLARKADAYLKANPR